MTRKYRFGLRREAILDIYILASGLFLLISPWLFGYVQQSGRVNAEIVGCALVALSAAAIIAFAEWEEWLNVALGAWLIVSPWFLGFVHTPAMHVSIAVGVIVTYLALLEIGILRGPRLLD